ncbi:hypothetical protein B0H15DRAFT_487208 [Mycena belliarum]|uniref:Uncharacterized protein n=1 Tax=Mycena belliarum TaxID=1033014 RepID=A0AAD6U0D1_9AGAR|nr:hypothetical protein B0H15DRAFT_487208 [Mycena belliae]
MSIGLITMAAIGGIVVLARLGIVFVITKKRHRSTELQRPTSEQLRAKIGRSHDSAPGSHFSSIPRYGFPCEFTLPTYPPP